MKRLVLFAATILVLIGTLTSCIVIHQYRYFEIDAATVSSVEIYDLCENDSRRSSFVETTKPVYEISAEKTSVFIDDLAKIRFDNPIIIVLAAIDPSFRYGTWTVRINYTDGSYELISSAGYGETFDKNGEWISSHHCVCEEGDWTELIRKYLPTQIFEHTH